MNLQSRKRFTNEPTVTGHADSQTFLEAAVLTSVTVEPDHHALAVPQTPILNLLLYAASEETLEHEMPKHFLVSPKWKTGRRW